MNDSHKYNAKGKVGVFGDPELVYAITGLCLECGMSPCLAASESENKQLAPKLELLAQEYKKEFPVLTETEYEKIAEAAREANANLLIGPSDGFFISEKYDIPLVRAGFPVHDRIGAQRKNFIGYAGSMNLMDELTNTLLDTKKSTSRKSIQNKLYGK
jgi:Nitrogenase molybdenum-iron protein, alpha and beta chains